MISLIKKVEGVLTFDISRSGHYEEFENSIEES